MSTLVMTMPGISWTGITAWLKDGPGIGNHIMNFGGPGIGGRAPGEVASHQDIYGTDEGTDDDTADYDDTPSGEEPQVDEEPDHFEL